ncbi:sensor histidine kinase [Streptomyces sp. NPDC001663]|uniref:sensor histidine kinase n=1 Tax=Streptomyces sp. NPDC001663 TaxID=3364597 RepID=UPI00367B2002
MAGRLTRPAAGAGAAVGLTALAVLAVRSDSGAPGAAAWLTALDVAVGLAFVAAGAVAGGPRTERGLFSAVGVTWLAGSVLPAARTWHQAVLALALTAFPAGRVRGAVQVLPVVLAVPVALGFAGQPGAVVLFTAVALTAWADRRADRTARGYPMAAAAVVAASLAAAFVVSRQWSAQFDPEAALFGYELVLLLVATAFPFAARSAARARAGLADRLLADVRLSGVEGLSAALGEVLGDPDLLVGRGQDAPDPLPADGRRVLTVPAGADGGDADHPVAFVVHRSAALDEPRVAAAFTAAVRLAVTHIGLQEEQRQRLRELTAARVRLLAAADRQRERIAAELRETAGLPLRTALARVEALRPQLHDPDVQAARDIAAGELRAAASDLADLVAGVPPLALGGGRLRQALQDIARSSPVPVTVDATADAVGDREAEAALFYVCSEALANAVKHADAGRIAISVRRRGPEIVAEVRDDGCGGADPAGSGLQGLGDRVATCGGRLRVDSPPGAGTTVTAAVPELSRSPGTA